MQENPPHESAGLVGRLWSDEAGEEGAEDGAGEVDAGVGGDAVASGDGELGGFV